MEAIYWGDGRLSGLNRTVYNVLNRFKTRGVFEGHVESVDRLRAPVQGLVARTFDDLGADSMLMARFCARVRKRADLPPVSIA